MRPQVTSYTKMSVYLHHTDYFAMEGCRVTWSHIQDLVAHFQTLLEVLRLLELRQLGVEGRRVRGRLECEKGIFKYKGSPGSC
jgi:hypothetical protein